MATEKELFVTRQYVPVGEPISQNEHNVVYKVKCIAEPGAPDGVLKMYRGKNITNLYTKLMQLDYSGWPHIYNVKYFDNNTLVVEAFLKGHTLAELIRIKKQQGQVFSDKEAGTIVEEICHITSVLAKQQPAIIHHDLRPSNIFITETGAVKLLDFVPVYPKKKNPLQSLIRAIGAIFHEMLTGKSPRGGKCTYAGIYEEFIKKCMEPNPDKQYTDFEEMEKDLAIAKKQKPRSSAKDTGTAGIPYYLTFPFQGFILCVEWILTFFFYAKNSMPTAILFGMAFVIHALLFTFRRHAYLKEREIYLRLQDNLLPPFIMAAVLGILSFLILKFVV